MSTRELLTEAISEEHISLNTCGRHPRTVYFDGDKCPACRIISEYRESWKGLEKPMPKKQKVESR